MHLRRLLPLLGALLLAAPLGAQAPAGATVAFITNKDGAHLSAYLPALAEAKDATTVVMADSSGAVIPEARRIIGKKLVATYASADELFRHYRPNLTVITLEPRLAVPAISAALDAGSYVMAEKPSCRNAAEFARLAKKAEEKKLPLMLALANRIHPEFRFARGLIRDGKLGKIYDVELTIVADQTRLGKPGYAETWIAQKARAGGGHLIWLGIHWLDLGMYLTGSDISEVAGFTANVGGQSIDVEDAAVMSLKFDNGALGTITSGYFLDKSYHSRVKIWGSRGWIEISLYGTDPFFRYYTTTEAHPVIRSYERPAGTDVGYSPFVAACVRASIGLQAPPVSTAESLRVIKTVFAAYRAAESGQTQRVN